MFVKTIARGRVVSLEDLEAESGQGRDMWRMTGDVEVPGDVVLPFRFGSVAVYVSTSLYALLGYVSNAFWSLSSMLFASSLHSPLSVKGLLSLIISASASPAAFRGTTRLLKRMSRRMNEQINYSSSLSMEYQCTCSARTVEDKHERPRSLWSNSTNPLLSRLTVS